MTKSGAKHLSRRARKGITATDVTLNDYANSNGSNSYSRIKKNTVNNVTDQVKLLNVSKDVRAWDEKLDELIPVLDDEDIENNNKVRGKSLKTKSLSSSSNDFGIDYPLDLWFLISEYIAPEEVGTFAVICKSSNYVVNTAKFWFSLYKRYYRSTDTIPQDLTPNNMTRMFRLRPQVIRSLYYVYPKFSQAIFIDVDKLIQRQCVNIWFKEVKNRWLYIFKIKKRCKKPYGRRSEPQPKHDLLEILSDINHNPDEDYQVLQILAKNYHPVPMVVGQILTTFSQKVAQNMTDTCLELQFSHGPSNYQASSITFDVVQKVCLLNWWDRGYPSFGNVI